MVGGNSTVERPALSCVRKENVSLLQKKKNYYYHVNLDYWIIDRVNLDL